MEKLIFQGGAHPFSHPVLDQFISQIRQRLYRVLHHKRLPDSQFYKFLPEIIEEYNNMPIERYNNEFSPANMRHFKTDNAVREILKRKNKLFPKFPNARPGSQVVRQYFKDEINHFKKNNIRRPDGDVSQRYLYIVEVYICVRT